MFEWTHHPFGSCSCWQGHGLWRCNGAIIEGGSASIAEAIMLKSMFRMPMIIAFLAVILDMAILAGYFFQFAL